jgi:hypothetical protein
MFIFAKMKGTHVHMHHYHARYSNIGAACPWILN